MASDDSYLDIREDSSDNILDVLVNDQTDDGVLTITSVSATERLGQVAVRDNHIAYTPAQDFVGTETFNYQIVDEQGESAVGHVTVEVTPVNDAPQLQLVPAGFEQQFDFQQTPARGWFGFTFGPLGDVKQDGTGDIFLSPRCGRDDRCDAWAYVTSGVDGAILSQLHKETKFTGGLAVTTAGDVNGDGLLDFLVGISSIIGSGRAMVYSGSDYSTIYEFFAEGLGSSFGDSVAGLGDINLDGVDDFAIAAPRFRDGEFFVGAARVYSGSDGSVLYELQGQPGVGDGGAVSWVGDVNADGASDFIFAGLVYSGTDGSVLRRVSSEGPEGMQDQRAQPVGDVNGDGHDDFAAVLRSRLGPPTGNVRVYSGADGSLLHEYPGRESTRSVAPLGDVNGDGFDDFGIGDSRDNGTGSLTVHSGTDGSMLTKFLGPLLQDSFGFASGSAGDINGDQLADIIVGSAASRTSSPEHAFRINEGNVTVFASTLAPRNYRLPTGDLNRPDGSSVAELFPDLLYDPDTDSLWGVAVVGTTARDRWQFSSNNGQSFQAIGDVDTKMGLLLGPSDRIRFDSTVGNDRTASIMIHGWDQTEGTRGQRVRIDQTGGETAFSAATTSALVHPDTTRRLLADGLDQTISFWEGSSAVPLDNVHIWSANPMARLKATLRLTSTSNGSLTAESGNGESFDRTEATWSVAGSVREVTAALAAVQFQPANEVPRVIPIDVSLSDTSDASQTLTGRIDLTSEPVNHAPRIRPAVVATEVFASHGNERDEQFGHSLSTAGDVDGDGFEDIIVGSPLADSNGPDAGEATVLSGLDGAVLHTFQGDGQFDQLGQDVAGAGDVNGDGRADLIVGAEFDDHNSFWSGSAYVYSGVDGRLFHAVHGEVFHQMGAGVGTAGDVNNDGFDDFIVGSPSLHDDRDFDPIITRVYSGHDGKAIWNFDGGIGNFGFGRKVGTLGDVNGDGFDEVYIGNPWNSSFDTTGVLVYSGQDGTVLYHLERSERTHEFIRNSFSADVHTGGDTDGDGVRDIVVGAPDEDAVYLFSGTDGLLLHKIFGEPGSQFGQSVLIVGDLDGDSFDDVLVGAPGDDARGEDAGRVGIHSSKQGNEIASIVGDSAGDRFGTSLASAVTSDGQVRLAVSAPFEDRTGLDTGSVWLYQLSAEPPLIVVPPVDEQPFESSVSDLIADQIVDSDPDAERGIAIHAIRGEGTWSYSVDGGATYNNIKAAEISSSTALLLRDSDLLRFMLGPDSEPAAEFDFRAWDQTSGTAGELVDATAFGGVSAFSVSLGTVRVSAPAEIELLTATNLQQSIVYKEDAPWVPIDDVIITAPDPTLLVEVRAALSNPSVGRLTTDPERADQYDHTTGLWRTSGTVDQVNEFLAELAFIPSTNNVHEADLLLTINSLTGSLEGNIYLAVTPVNDAPATIIDHVVSEFGVSSAGFGYRRGVAVAAGGDVNGDGFPDFAVATPQLSPRELGGVVDVFSGLDLTELYTLQGERQDFGRAFAFLPDVNGDGLDDLVVNSPRDSGNRRIQVFSGHDGSEHLSISGGIDEAFAVVADINDDGVSDFLSGSDGRAHIYSGVDGALLRTHTRGLGQFGDAVAQIGDLTGDGVPEYALGSPRERAVFVYSGADGGIVHQIRHDAESFGSVLSRVADVTGDGVPEIVVGAPDARNSRGIHSGIALLFSGGDAALLSTFEGESAGLGSHGIGTGGFGAAVADAGDFDGDGTPDIVIGERNSDNAGRDSGSIHVYSGTDGQLLWSVHGNGTGSVDFDGDTLGASIATADLNRDGIIDYVAGTPGRGFDSGGFNTYVSRRSVSLPPSELLNAMGHAVSDIIAERLLDVDEDPLGIAVQAVSGTGNWEYSLDNGQSFQPVGAVDRGNVLLLRGDWRIRYQRGEADVRTASIEFAGWDQTQGQAGTTVDANELETTNSLSSRSLLTQWTFPIQNHPVVATNIDQFITFDEGTADVRLGRIEVTDPDASEEITVSFTLEDSAAGQLNDPQFAGTVTQVNERLQDIRFFPSADYDVSTSIVVAISDGGEDGVRPATGTIVLEVNAMNDAPVLRRHDELTIDGGEGPNEFGFGVAALGDVDGDDRDDVAVVDSCRTGPGCLSHVLVYSGASGTQLLDIPVSGLLVQLVGIGDGDGDGVPDLAIGARDSIDLYSGATGDFIRNLASGRTISSVGDINGDGIGDIGVASFDHGVYSGADGSLIRELDIEFLAPEGIGSAGDVNGDGRDDIIVADRLETFRGQGTALVLSGADNSTLHTFPVPWQIVSVSGAGDVDADGHADLIVGGNRTVVVFSGRDGTELFSMQPDDLSGLISSVARVGDANGDGTDDFLVAWRDSSGSAGGGRIYSGADATELFTFTSEVSNFSFVPFVIPVGDTNADGLADVLVKQENAVTIIRPIDFWEIETGPLTAPSRGATVQELFPKLATDVDTGSSRGIAVQATDGAGVWEYSLDGGNVFQPFGSVSPSVSLLLGESDRIRYVIRQPSAHGPNATFRLVAWDQTSGQVGTKTDSSAGGGASSFSRMSAKALLHVSPDDALDPNLVAGDANRDFRIDQLDIVQVLTRGKFETDAEAFWADGDWNGDGRFDQADLVELLAGNNYLAPSPRQR